MVPMDGGRGASGAIRTGNQLAHAGGRRGRPVGGRRRLAGKHLRDGRERQLDLRQVDHRQRDVDRRWSRRTSRGRRRRGRRGLARRGGACGSCGAGCSATGCSAGAGSVVAGAGSSATGCCCSSAAGGACSSVAAGCSAGVAASSVVAAHRSRPAARRSPCRPPTPRPPWRSPAPPAPPGGRSRARAARPRGRRGVTSWWSGSRGTFRRTMQRPRRGFRSPARYTERMAQARNFRLPSSRPPAGLASGSRSGSAAMVGQRPRGQCRRRGR